MQSILAPIGRVETLLGFGSLGLLVALGLFFQPASPLLCCAQRLCCAALQPCRLLRNKTSSYCLQLSARPFTMQHRHRFTCHAELAADKPQASLRTAAPTRACKESTARDYLRIMMQHISEPVAAHLSATPLVLCCGSIGSGILLFPPLLCQRSCLSLRPRPASQLAHGTCTARMCLQMSMPAPTDCSLMAH